jgi:tight adherence protein C
VSAVGAFVGIAAVASVALVGSWARDRRRLGMADRIAPFTTMRGPARRRHDPTVGFGTLARWASTSDPVAPAPGLEGLLAQAGRQEGAAHYRLERLVWAGALAAAAGLLGWWLEGPDRLAPALLLAGVGAIAGWGGCDLALRHQARRRRAVLERQLPTLVDLVALAVTAGATPVVALERAAATVGGPIAVDVGAAMGRIRGGESVDGCLRAMSAATGLAAMSRFVEALLVAVERGSPLADVAMAQSTDIRAHERRVLMEAAGRKDVAMLVPIVFLVLPTVVAIALFPGMQTLHLVVP